MSESTAQLHLLPIADLLERRFVVPAYQRGYRWTERQVEELLDDLREFLGDLDGLPSEAFYCLQPIVVRPRDDGRWEVIDGQQRLTTLLLIMRFLEPIMTLLRKQRYELTYDTRPRSAEFLETLDENQRDANVDFHHLFRAYQTISAWFENHDGGLQLDLLNRLLAVDKHNVRVIWYELPPTEDPIEVFIRLNVGKIPLTNGELIRALFLRRLPEELDAPADRRLRIAHEWDAIEKQLQDERFWHFVHRGASPYPARIEYLFAIRVRSLPDHVPSRDEYATFIAYNEHFRSGDPKGRIEQRWKDIRGVYQRLREWRDDRVLYHLVGFCVATAQEPSHDVIVELLSRRARMTRTRFELSLRSTIFRRIFKHDPEEVSAEELEDAIAKRLDRLSYDVTNHHPEIRAALLLFNIATLVRNPTSSLQFPFDLYERQPWDIEHIRSVKSDMPERIDHQRDWLRRLMEYWGEGGSEPEAEELTSLAAGALATEPFDTRGFQDLYERVLTHFGEQESTEADHALSNLALLDAPTNRSYKNAVFPLKRRRILGLDKVGTYVPLCTTNVFLKYYSDRIDNMMFWTLEDAHSYRAAMIETLHDFFHEVVP